jgi:hypothetical protein
MMRTERLMRKLGIRREARGRMLSVSIGGCLVGVVFKIGELEDGETEGSFVGVVIYLSATVCLEGSESVLEERHWRIKEFDVVEERHVWWCLSIGESSGFVYES